MNKSLILGFLLHICVQSILADIIPVPVAVQSSRNHEVHSVDIESHYNSPGSPHVFEIEPIQTPLRIVFSSASSPLYLDVEKALKADAVERVKQDRSGAAPVAQPDAAASGVDPGIEHIRTVHVGPELAGSTFNEDDYRVVDQYERVVPVRVRDHFVEEVAQPQTDQVVVVKPQNAKLVNSRKKNVQNPKKARITAKAEKMTTVKPTQAPVATAAPVADKSTAKFGARISRNTDKQTTAKKAKTTQ